MERAGGAMIMSAGKDRLPPLVSTKSYIRLVVPWQLVLLVRNYRGQVDNGLFHR